MNLKMKSLTLVIALLFFASGCTWWEKQSRNTKAGAGIGAVVGGVAGILLNSHNPWKGGVIGAAVGAVAGGLIGNIVDYSSREAVKHNQPVKYSRTTEGGNNEELYASPGKTEGSYKQVTVKYVRDGKVMGEEVRKEPLP